MRSFFAFCTTAHGVLACCIVLVAFSRIFAGLASMVVADDVSMGPAVILIVWTGLGAFVETLL